jgi:hypothetical protein
MAKPTRRADPFYRANLKSAPESTEDVVVGGAIGHAEEGIDIDGKIGSDLVDQSGIDRSDPGLMFPRTDGVVELKVSAQVAYDGARDSYRILPLHTHVPAARLV